MIKFTRLFAIAVLLFAAAGAARADTAFNAKTLEAAQATGKPVLVHVNADWCPTCAKQRPVISALLQTPEFKDYQLLKLDFDSQKADLRMLKVQTQSTLIVYKGKQELGRSTGETSKAAIVALLKKAL